LAATVNLVGAAGLLVASAPRLRPAAAVPALLALVVTVLPSWDEQVLASGAYLYGEQYAAAARALRMDLKTYLAKESTIVARYWDAYGLTTVHRSDDGSLSIRVNGKADASTGTADMPTQRTVGNLGMLHHPAPKRALVIGLANGGILKDPRVRLVIGDGRNAVQFAKEPYDVIVSQPSNLWISGMSNLFTREFFAMASHRLTPDGVFCQWVQAYRMPLDDFRSILRTFFEVFPEGSFWEIFPGQDYILLGSTTPIRIPYGELEARLSAPGLKEHFDGLHVPGAAGLLGHFVAGAPDVRTAVATAPLLTDDQSTIEYTTSKAMFTFMQPRTIAWVQELRRSKLDAECYPGAEVGAVQRSRESQGRIAHVIGYEGERHSAREVLELLTKETGGLGEDEP